MRGNDRNKYARIIILDLAKKLEIISLYFSISIYHT